jgi:hypothetical protein
MGLAAAGCRASVEVLQGRGSLDTWTLFPASGVELCTVGKGLEGSASRSLGRFLALDLDGCCWMLSEFDWDCGGFFTGTIGGLVKIACEFALELGVCCWMLSDLDCLKIPFKRLTQRESFPLGMATGRHERMLLLNNVPGRFD